MSVTGKAPVATLGAVLGSLLLLAVPADIRAGNLLAEVQDLRVELVSEPDRPFRNKETIYTLRLRDSSGATVNGAKPTLAGRMADGMTVLTPLRPTGEAGVYTGRVLFTMEGAWQITLRVSYQGKTLELPLAEEVRR